MKITAKILGFLTAFMLLAAVMAIPAEPVRAAEQAGEGASAAVDIKGLIDRLEDPAQRQRLVKDLGALLDSLENSAARSANAAAEAPDVLSASLDAITGGLADIGGQILDVTQQLGDPAGIAGWFSDQATQAERRNLWLDIVIYLAATFAAGLALAWLLHLMLVRPREALEQHESAGLIERLVFLALRTLVDILPLAIFAATAYGVAAVGGAGRVVDGVVLSAVHAVVISRAVLSLGRMVFTPFSPALRLIKLADETSAYAFIWLRRLVNVPVYGFFAAQIALTLGLPDAGYVAVTKLIGLAEALLILVLVMQIRDAVSARLKSSVAEDSAGALMLAGLRRRLGEVWHILAGLYVAAAYLIWALEIEGGFLYITQGTLGSVVVVTAAWGVRLAVARGLVRLFRIPEKMRRRYPVLEERANRYLPLATKVAVVLIYIIAALLILRAWQADVGLWLASDFGRLVILRALNVLVIVVLALLVWEGFSTMITVYLEKTDDDGAQVVRSARARTLLPLAKNALMIVILTMATLVMLSEFGIDIGPLLAGAGVIGLAIGFGAQTLVKDIITGAFILFEDSIAVGDYVTVGGLSGTVEGMTIRTIRLRDVRGTVHTVPFSTVDTVTNMTKDFAFHIAEVGVAYREDVDEVCALLVEIGEQMQQDPDVGADILEPIAIDGVNSLDDSAVVVRARIKTKPGSQWRIKRDFNGRVKRLFDARGIEIPYPHQTIYFGEDKEGRAPPLHVRQAEGAPPSAGPARAPETTASPRAKTAPGDERDDGDGGDGTP